MLIHGRYWTATSSTSVEIFHRFTPRIILDCYSLLLPLMTEQNRYISTFIKKLNKLQLILQQADSIVMLVIPIGKP